MVTNELEFRTWFRDSYREDLENLTADVGKYHFVLKRNKRPSRYSVSGNGIRSTNVWSGHISCVIFSHVWKMFVAGTLET